MLSSLYKLKKNKTSTDDGLTLIECLVAITVIALSSATIAPVLVLSVATRVQNQKAEQALQLAQGEIDRVRLLVERNPTYTNADLKLPQASSATVASTSLASVGPPTSSADLTHSALAGYSGTNEFAARQIDTDGDLSPDFLLQSFRGSSPMVNIAPAGSPPVEMPVAFGMGVRVYDFNAVGDTPTGLSTTAARIGITSGESDRGSRPLAVLYTQIINSDNSQSLCEYIKFLGASVPATMVCN